MSVLKRAVVLFVLAVTAIAAQGPQAKVFPPTVEQKTQIHAKLAGCANS